MSNQETNRKWYDGVTQEVPSFKSQKDIKIRPEEAAQLAKAYYARLLGNSANSTVGLAYGLIEASLLTAAATAATTATGGTSAPGTVATGVVAYKKTKTIISIAGEIAKLVNTKKPLSMDSLTQYVNDYISESSDFSQDGKDQMQKKANISKATKIILPLVIDYLIFLLYQKMSTSEKLTNQELDFLNLLTAQNPITDSNKTSVWDYIDIPQAVFDESEIGGIVTSMEEIMTASGNAFQNTAQDVDRVKREANRSNNTIKGWFTNFDVQKIVEQIPRMFNLSKNNSTTSTLAQADSEDEPPKMRTIQAEFIQPNIIQEPEPTEYEIEVGQFEFLPLRVLATDMSKLLTQTGETQETSDSDKQAEEEEEKRKEKEEKERLRKIAEAEAKAEELRLKKAIEEARIQAQKIEDGLRKIAEENAAADAEYQKQQEIIAAKIVAEEEAVAQAKATAEAKAIAIADAIAFAKAQEEKALAQAENLESQAKAKEQAPTSSTPTSRVKKKKAKKQVPTSQPSLLGSIMNGLNKVNPFAIAKIKKEQDLEKRRVINAERRERFKAHRAREIANDPSMEYFYSAKYQEETQFMYGGGGIFSNTNSLEANNFSSPARGSSDSNFNFSSNDNSPLKLDIPNVDDFVKDPKLIQVVQNIANNEAYKQLYEYNQEIYKGFQDESPVTAQDRDTLDQLHGLIVDLQFDEDERERVEKSEREKRAKNPPQMAKSLWWMK